MKCFTEFNKNKASIRKNRDEDLDNSYHTVLPPDPPSVIDDGINQTLIDEINEMNEGYFAKVRGIDDRKNFRESLSYDDTDDDNDDDIDYTNEEEMEIIEGDYNIGNKSLPEVIKLLDELNKKHLASGEYDRIEIMMDQKSSVFSGCIIYLLGRPKKKVKKPRKTNK